MAIEFNAYTAPCDDEVELIGTTSPLAGIPRVCVDNRWGKVCIASSDRNDELASVICSQLGYSQYGELKYLLIYWCPSLIFVSTSNIVNQLRIFT